MNAIIVAAIFFILALTFVGAKKIGGRFATSPPPQSIVSTSGMNIIMSAVQGKLMVIFTNPLGRRPRKAKLVAVHPTKGARLTVNGVNFFYRRSDLVRVA